MFLTKLNNIGLYINCYFYLSLYIHNMLYRNYIGPWHLCAQASASSRFPLNSHNRWVVGALNYIISQIITHCMFYIELHFKEMCSILIYSIYIHSLYEGSHNNSHDRRLELHALYHRLFYIACSTSNYITRRCSLFWCRVFYIHVKVQLSTSTLSSTIDGSSAPTIT